MFQKPNFAHDLDRRAISLPATGTFEIPMVVTFSVIPIYHPSSSLDPVRTAILYDESEQREKKRDFQLKSISTLSPQSKSIYTNIKER